MLEAKHPGSMHKGEVRKDVRAMGGLRRAVEVAKRTLSMEMSTEVEIVGFHGGEDLGEVVTRVDLEKLNTDLFERIIKTMDNVMKWAKLKKRDIDEVWDLSLILS
jgi:endoplasmic reticulum chaperone BiP